MKKVKRILSSFNLILGLIVSNIAFPYSNVMAASDHDCMAAYTIYTGVPVTTIHGQATKCKTVRTYDVYRCWYCGLEDYRVLTNTNLVTSHSGSSNYWYCDGTYLNYRHVCPDCSFVVSSSKTVCTRHPIHPN